MKTPPCKNKGCSNKIGFYHILEESYYCENCTCLMFKEEECERIGDYKIIKQLIVLCKELLEEILNYANEEMLNLKWESALQIQKTFASVLIDIKKSFDGAINNCRPKDLRLLQKRLISLKSQIIESEAYTKYLIHKDLKSHKLDDDIGEERLSIKFLENYWKKLKTEEEKTSRLIEDDKLDDKNLSENQLIVSCDGIQNICNINLKHNEEYSLTPSISHDVFTVLCKYHVSTLPSTSQGAFEFTSDLSDPNAMISFNLSCPSTLSFLSLLSSFRLPYINWYYFNNVPPDCESLNSYLISAMPNLNMFYFNVTHLVQIEGSKYIEALKAVAKKTSLLFYVYYTNFTSREFCDLISCCSSIKGLYFCLDNFNLDEEADFGDMEGSVIGLINLIGSGEVGYGDWREHPVRFANLIAGIAKSKGLRESLKELDLSYCGVTREQVDQEMKKRGLVGIEVKII